MPKRIPLAAAALLAGAVTPAAAVQTVQLGSITDVETATSEVAAYNEWAANCPNVSTSGLGCGAVVAPLDSDRTLFFWGARGNTNNTTIEVEWTGTQPSEVIRNVAIRTADTEPMGPASGPRSFRFAPSFVPGTWEANFGAPTQGEGLFLAYGRNEYAFDSSGGAAEWESTRTAPYFVASFNASVSLPGLAAEDIVVDGTPFQLFDPFPNQDGTAISTAQPFPVDILTELPQSKRGSLSNGDVLTIELFVGSATSPVPGDVPVGFMDDISIQLNVGPRLELDPAKATTPGVPDVELGDVRAGTSGTAGDITAENTGEALSGNPTLELTFNAVTGDTTQIAAGDGGSLNDSIDLAPGDTFTRSFTLDGSGIDLDLTDTDGQTFQVTQEVSLRNPNDFIQNPDDLADPTGPQTRTVSGTVVGPILGVRADDGARYLPYNSSADADKIDLGTVEIGTDPPGLQKLLIENLFGADLGMLTSLSLLNVGIDDASDPRNYYCILTAMTGDCASGAEIASAFEKIILGDGNLVSTDGSQGSGTTPLPDMWIQFDPTRNVTDYEAILFFETDMNTAFGNNSGRLSFTLTGSSFGYEPTPTPASLALIGLGLAGLAGVRARRASARR
ncbi:hypothetical protein [uncultured Thiohalocapsa sp.]|uniref:hypothetical protein n=1 Tax=uncultured Thiohalocapsa sp. TaxID=768990 RepID=UPI0025E59AC1|nr:hypothetical protein [uncultured Thiohalocapsa sp.]